MQYFNFGLQNEVIIYIEKFNKDLGFVLFDFVDSNEFATFDSITGLNYNWEARPTMVQLTNYFQRPIQEGVYYFLSQEALRTLNSRIQIVEDSLVIGFRIELSPKDLTLFEKSKYFNDFERFLRHIDLPSDSSLKSFEQKAVRADRVIIRNVGQGNWNELVYRNKFQIIYDFGTIYTTKKNEVIKLIGDRDNEYQISKPIFILSHWDVDHYHMLLGFNNNTIRALRYFIHRSTIPNLTARKALGRINNLNPNAVLPLDVADPFPKRSSLELFKINLTTNKSILLYNSYKNRSRNKSGIGLTFRNKQTSVIFSGDYDYTQVSNYILPDLNYDCKHYLIVPHHGGNAGNFLYSSSKKLVLCDAVISVGKNPYNPAHPHPKNINSLKQKGFSVVRTDMLNTDYVISL